MHEHPAPSASARLARYACAFAPEGLTAPQLKQVGRALIDTVGVALAGRAEPAAAALWRYVGARAGAHPAGLGAGPGRGAAAASATATAWGRHNTLPLEDAALYNGVAGHVLDFDDVNGPMRGHPSIALLPPLVALAESRGMDGRRLAAAYVVGFETLVKLGRAMVHDHYARGWHATTTLGTIAAAVACCHLLELDEAQTVNAIGLAVAQAAGTRGNFGTMAKSFQAGHCGAAALRAALLAELGMDGAADALDGAQGFAHLYGKGEDLSAALAGLGDAPLEIEASGLEIKKYPLCYATHRAIDGMLDLRAEHGLQADDVAAVHVVSNRRAMVPLIHDRPRTGLEAKFSMPYAMAAALLDGHVRLASFTDRAVQRPAVQALMARVTRAEDDGPEMPRWNALAVTLRSGRVLHKEIRQLRGSSACPLSDDELRDKWRDCLGFGGADPERGERFFEMAMALEAVPVRELMQALPPMA